MNHRRLLSYGKTLLGIIHGSTAYGGPLQANLSLTNKCNINCHHCYYHSPHVEMSSFRPVRKARLNGVDLPEASSIKSLRKIEADPSSMKGLIDELLSMGTLRFHFSGSGEPLMHKNALAFIDRIKQAGSACDVNTNGLLLTPEIVDELVEMKCDALRITVMGGTREIYERIHGGITADTYETLERNLIYLAEKKRALGVNQPEVTLVCVVIAPNHDGLLDVARFASFVGADSVYYRPVDSAGDENLAKLIPSTEQFDAMKKVLVDSRAYLELKKIDHNINIFSNVFREKLDTTEFYKIVPCYYGWLSVSIDADGLLYFCCRSFEPLGNVFENGFRDVWKSQKYASLRQKAIRINKDRVPLPNCDCFSCIHHGANLRVFRLCHPFKRNNVYQRESACSC